MVYLDMAYNCFGMVFTLVYTDEVAMKHRGTDPEAIKVADNLGLLFDGIMCDYAFSDHPITYYQFTIAPGQLGAGITFCVRELSQVKTRLNEKLREFGLKE